MSERREVVAREQLQCASAVCFLSLFYLLTFVSPRSCALTVNIYRCPWYASACVDKKEPERLFVLIRNVLLSFRTRLSRRQSSWAKLHLPFLISSSLNSTFPVRTLPFTSRREETTTPGEIVTPLRQVRCTEVSPQKQSFLVASWPETVRCFGQCIL